MTRRYHGAVLMAPLLAGCIFGSGKEPKITNNGSFNNTTSSNNTTGSNNIASNNGATNVSTNNVATNNVSTNNNSPDMGGVDAGEPEQTYLPLMAAPDACGNPRTLWYAPSPTSNATITEDTVVSSAAPPKEWVGLADIGTVTVAHASRVNGGIWVYAAAGRMDSAAKIVPIHEAEDMIPDGEVWAVLPESRWISRTNDAPVAELIKVTVATSGGIYACTMTLDLSDESAMSCVRSPLNTVLSNNGIDSPARVDFAPVYQTLVNGRYAYGLVGINLLAAVSGPTASGEQLGVVRVVDDAVTYVDISGAIDTTLDAPEVFAERTAFGVEDTSFGYPVLLALARQNGGALQPTVLEAGAPNSYETADRGAWELSDRLTPSRKTFTFIDGYDVRVEPQYALLRVVMDPGELSVGYVGIDPATQTLVFSQPGGFGGFDFMEFSLPKATEVAAFRNIPLDATTSGAPVIAVIHGDAREKLALFTWDFGLAARVVEDALAADFSDAHGMNANWFVSDSGSIAMIAQRAGAWVAAIVPVPDVSDLSAGCN